MNKIRKIMSSQAGFTLIELLIVIVILGVLSAIVIPRMLNLTNDARINAGKSSLRSLYNGLEMSAVKTGSYTTTGGLSSYIQNFSGLDSFLGEWKEDTSGTNNIDSGPVSSSGIVLSIVHEADDSLKLDLMGDGTITGSAVSTP